LKNVFVPRDICIGKLTGLPHYKRWTLQQDFPVPFNKEHKHMLAQCKEMLEYRNGMVAINPKHARYGRLIIASHTTMESGEGMLDKDATSDDDLFDAWVIPIDLALSVYLGLALF
jgi:hypothetical protein